VIAFLDAIGLKANKRKMGSASVNDPTRTLGAAERQSAEFTKCSRFSIRSYAWAGTGPFPYPLVPFGLGPTSASCLG
jgi:hypothetical protein